MTRGLEPLFVKIKNDIWWPCLRFCNFMEMMDCDSLRDYIQDELEDTNTNNNVNVNDKDNERHENQVKHQVMMEYWNSNQYLDSVVFLMGHLEHGEDRTMYFDNLVIDNNHNDNNNDKAKEFFSNQAEMFRQYNQNKDWWNAVVQTLQVMKESQSSLLTGKQSHKKSKQHKLMKKKKRSKHALLKYNNNNNNITTTDKRKSIVSQATLKRTASHKTNNKKSQISSLSLSSTNSTPLTKRKRHSSLLVESPDEFSKQYAGTVSLFQESSPESSSSSPESESSTTESYSQEEPSMSQESSSSSSSSIDENIKEEESSPLPMRTKKNKKQQQQSQKNKDKTQTSKTIRKKTQFAQDIEDESTRASKRVSKRSTLATTSLSSSPSSVVSTKSSYSTVSAASSVMDVSIPKTHDAIRILKDMKKGFKLGDSGYYCPPSSPQTQLGVDYFDSITGLRKYLCAYGYEQSDYMTHEDTYMLRRWIRFAIVPCLRNKTTIPPEGTKLLNFAEAWKLLQLLGFTFTNASGYRLPHVGVPNRRKKKVQDATAADTVTTNSSTTTAANDKQHTLIPPQPGINCFPSFENNTLDGTQGLWVFLARFGLPSNCSFHKITEMECLQLELYLADCPDVKTKFPQRVSADIVNKRRTGRAAARNRSRTDVTTEISHYEYQPTDPPLVQDGQVQRTYKSETAMEEEEDNEHIDNEALLQKEEEEEEEDVESNKEASSSSSSRQEQEPSLPNESDKDGKASEQDEQRSSLVVPVSTTTLEQTGDATTKNAPNTVADAATAAQDKHNDLSKNTTTTTSGGSIAAVTLETADMSSVMSSSPTKEDEDEDDEEVEEEEEDNNVSNNSNVDDTDNVVNDDTASKSDMGPSKNPITASTTVFGDAPTPPIASASATEYAAALANTITSKEETTIAIVDPTTTTTSTNGVGRCDINDPSSYLLTQPIHDDHDDDYDNDDTTMKDHDDGTSGVTFLKRTPLNLSSNHNCNTTLTQDTTATVEQFDKASWKESTQHPESDHEELTTEDYISAVGSILFSEEEEAEEEAEEEQEQEQTQLTQDDDGNDQDEASNTSPGMKFAQTFVESSSPPPNDGIGSTSNPRHCDSPSKTSTGEVNHTMSSLEEIGTTQKEDTNDNDIMEIEDDDLGWNTADNNSSNDQSNAMLNANLLTQAPPPEQDAEEEQQQRQQPPQHGEDKADASWKEDQNIGAKGDQVEENQQVTTDKGTGEIDLAAVPAQKQSDAKVQDVHEGANDNASSEECGTKENQMGKEKATEGGSFPYSPIKIEQGKKSDTNNGNAVCYESPEPGKKIDTEPGFVSTLERVRLAKEKLKERNSPVLNNEEWPDLYRKLCRHQIIRWKTGNSLSGYFYIISGGRGPRDGGKLGVDYFESEHDLKDWVREHFDWSDGSPNRAKTSQLGKRSRRDRTRRPTGTKISTPTQNQKTKKKAKKSNGQAENSQSSPKAPSPSKASSDTASQVTSATDTTATDEHTTQQEEETVRLTEPERKRKAGRKLQSAINALRISYDFGNLAALSNVREGSTEMSKFETRVNEVNDFLHAVKDSRGSYGFNSNEPASLYICGAPGTGKTSTVRWCAKQIEQETKSKGIVPTFCFINGAHIQSMSSNATKLVIKDIAEHLDIGLKNPDISHIKNKLDLEGSTSPSHLLFLVIDEIDLLLSDRKAQGACNSGEKVLSVLFDLASDKRYSLGMIGISNAIGNKNARRLINLGNITRTTVFTTYRKEDLVNIVEQRIGRTIVDPKAIEFAAAKVSTSSGDARKVLDLTASAVSKRLEKMSNEQKSSTTLPCPLVKLPHMMQAVKATNKRFADVIDGLPQMAKVVLCVAVALAQVGPEWKVLTLGTLKRYCAEASNHNLMDDELNMETFASIIQQLTDSGLLLMGGISGGGTNDATEISQIAHSDVYFTKVQLGVQLQDVESAIEKTLLDQDFYQGMIEYVRKADPQNGNSRI